MTNRSFDLERLLEPLAPETFFQEHWEKEYLLLRRQDPSFYGSLFSYGEFDRGLHAARDTLRAMVAIVPPPDSGRDFRTVRGIDLNLKDLYQAFNRGDTLTVREGERLWPQLAQLAGTLTESLSAVVRVNLYLTPPKSQGFKVHIDTHDVFILQVDGAKEWHLYDTYFALPMEDQESRQSIRKRSKETLPAEPALRETVRLEKGDLLYVPRGVPHKAATLESSSLHLTVGIHPLYWTDLIKAAVESLAYDSLDLRRALPPGVLDDSDLQQAQEGRFRELIEGIGEKLADAFPAAFETMVQCHLGRQHYPPDGHFEQLVQLDGLHVESVVHRRTGLSCELTKSGNGAGIRFPNNEITGPAGIAPALDFISKQRRFRIKDIPRLDDQSRVVLTRRLVKEGLLRTESRGSSSQDRGEREAISAS